MTYYLSIDNFLKNTFNFYFLFLIEVSKKKRRTHFIEDSLAIKRESINNESAFVKTVANLKRFHFANTESACTTNMHRQNQKK